MQDVPNNGYWSDDDKESKSKLGPRDPGTKVLGDEYSQNLDLYLRTRSEPVKEPRCSYSSMLMENSESRLPPGKVKLRRRSLSIPAMRKNGSAIDPILSGAPQR